MKFVRKKGKERKKGKLREKNVLTWQFWQGLNHDIQRKICTKSLQESWAKVTWTPEQETDLSDLLRAHQTLISSHFQKHSLKNIDVWSGCPVANPWTRFWGYRNSVGINHHTRACHCGHRFILLGHTNTTNRKPGQMAGQDSQVMHLIVNPLVLKCVDSFAWHFKHSNHDWRNIPFLDLF